MTCSGHCCVDENCVGVSGVRSGSRSLMYITKDDGIYVTHSTDGMAWLNNLSAAILNAPIPNDK